MIYRSNLYAPDLTDQFPHLHSRVMGHSFGHDVLSDWADQDESGEFAFYKNCGMWTHDEAAILYNVARKRPGVWLDIGSHTGWTAAHILAAGASDVWAVDPMYRVRAFRERATNQANLIPVPYTSAEFFARTRGARKYAGIVIDGDHEPGLPLEDASNAVAELGPAGVILFHDFVGRPVRDAVGYLIDSHGFRCQIYLTPHVVAVCWREGFQPPFHMPEAGLVEQQLFKRWPERHWIEYA